MPSCGRACRPQNPLRQRRNRGPTNDDSVVSDSGTPLSDGPRQVLELYDRSMPQVYGYLVSRCRDQHLAEELTAETFLAAIEAAAKSSDIRLTAGWLVTVARNKLAD